MRRSFKLNHVAAAAMVTAFSAAALFACSDDETPATPKTDAGSSGTSGTSGTSGDSGPTTLSLYERLGGKSGLESFVATVVDGKVLADADLKTYFFAQVATPIPAGRPSKQQIVVCFARFVGAALKADTYPGAPVNDPANTNNPNHTCRSMVDSHKANLLFIGNGTFDKFVGAIAASLQPLVKPTATKAGEITQAEFDALAGALNGQKGDITLASAPNTGPYPGTLYDRLGGQAGLEAFVSSVTVDVLADADLVTYFFNQTNPGGIPAGHPSKKQIDVCFARFVGAALKADTYPGAPVNDPANTNTPNHTCRNMVASHKAAGTQLNIGTGTFDKFVGIIAAKLTPLKKAQVGNTGPITERGISQEEFDALAGALNAQKADVTTAGAPVGPGPFTPPP